jgi:4-hydroxy 2-oxovalerate aldolase
VPLNWAKMDPLSDGTTLLDVTLRDGGYVNNHSWSHQEASEILAACAEAHVPYCEVGYFRPGWHETGEAGLPSSCCPPDYLRHLHERHPRVTLAVMAHSRDLELADYQRLPEFGVGLVRLPAQTGLLPLLPAHITAAQDAGLRVSLNLIRVSELTPDDVVRAAALADECDVDIFYLADSNSSLFPDDVTELVGVAAGATRVPLGFHAHDGLSLAFINSITAVRAGCTYLDASLGGMGKGGGNLPMELVVGYLRSRTQARLSMAPLVRAVATVLKPWKNGVTTRCESIASGLLDLNLDSIAILRDDDTKELVSLIDTLPLRPDPCFRS